MSDQPATDVYTREELEAMTVTDLKAIAAEEGASVSSSATKGELVDAILAVQETPDAAPETTEPATTPEPSDQSNPNDISQMSEEEFQAYQDQLRAQQGIEVGSGTVPEQRPQAFLSGQPQGEIYERMVARDDPRVSQEPMGLSEYQAALGEGGDSVGVERLYPGAYVRVNYEDDDEHPDNGRTGAVLRVESYVDVANTLLAQAGVPEARFAKVAFYEVRTRDGRHELLHVAPENLERMDANTYYKSPT